ncbi:hypothetical protein B0H17DRAFT_1277770 [Mycena rosella]|uniref:Uncharacterized protein n=1 Tax=Mycena rosella TaxID=1033263 RepID=A0AAD7C4T6_MYCRO|nr:hypothetical protein B0H17DRAFT_1277770 [Mycena rosella]
MDYYTASTSPRAPPFSLVEFGDLVSAALESPDPLFSNASRLFSLDGRGENLQEGDGSSSRVRQMLKKFKKRAATLVKRPSTRPMRPSSPEYRIPELRLSTCFRNASCEEFVPYIPLVAQYERMSPAYRSTPALPTQCAAPSLYTNSNSSHSSFAPTPSTSSCSSATTASFPTTPLTTVSEEGFPPRRWSASSSTDADSEPPTPRDPFAKHALRVVPRSKLAAYPSPSPSPTRPTRRRRRPARVAPAQPPPARPIPPPPFAHTHPYRRAQPRPASPVSFALLDAFPAPPSHTPSPPVTPPRRTRAPPRPLTLSPPWLDLSSPPESDCESDFHSARSH